MKISMLLLMFTLVNIIVYYEASESNKERLHAKKNYSQNFTQDFSNKTPFQKALAMGRTVNYGEAEKARSSILSFASKSGVVEQKIDQACDCIVWSRFDTDSSKAISSDSIRSDAIAFLDSHQDDFRVSSVDLEDAEHSLVEPRPGMKVLNFKRFYQGIPVEDAYVQFIYLEQADSSYRMAEYVNRSFVVLSLISLLASSNFLKKKSKPSLV